MPQPDNKKEVYRALERGEITIVEGNALFLALQGGRNGRLVASFHKHDKSQFAPSHAEALANAHLFKAAPLMLAALEAMLEPWSSFSDHELSLYYRPILNARAAIKAVRGE